MHSELRRAILLTALAAAGLAHGGAACGQDAPQPLPPAQLRWKWAVGQELRYRSRSLQKQSVSGPRDMDGEVEQTLVWRHKVTAVDELGIASLETVYEQVQFRMKNAGGEITFDSAKDKFEDPNLSPFVLYLTALVDRPFQLQVDRRGKVRAVVGFDKIRAAMIANLEKDAMAEAQSKALAARYSDKAIAEQFQLLYRLGNGLAVKAEESWERAYTLGVAGLGDSKVTDTLTVLGAELSGGRPCVKISLSSKIRLDPNEAPPGWRVSMEAGKSGGTILFDEAAGALRSLEIKSSQTLIIKAPPGMSELDTRQKVTALQSVTALPLTDGAKGEGSREREQEKGSR